PRRARRHLRHARVARAQRRSAARRGEPPRDRHERKDPVNRRPKPRLRRAAAVVAGLAAAALLLSGCLYAMIPETRPSQTHPPDTSGVSAELLPFYSQTLEWRSCGTGFDCTEITAPLDWENPGAADISLAVV